MYGALQRSLRSLLDDVRDAILQSGPDDDLVAVAINAYVQHLVTDPAAATIVLLEGVATSPEVNGLRSRAPCSPGKFPAMRREHTSYDRD